MQKSLTTRVDRKGAESARIAARFVRMMSPETPKWLLGVSHSGGRTDWREFPAGSAEALAWLTRVYGAGASPVYRSPRLLAATADAPEAFLADKETTAHAVYAHRGRYVGVWRMNSDIPSGQSAWLASKFAAKAPGSAPLDAIPIPGNTLPAGIPGGVMIRRAFQAPSYGLLSDKATVSQPIPVKRAAEQDRSEELLEAMGDFKAGGSPIGGTISRVLTGPTVTTYCVVLNKGLKASALIGLEEDLARVLSVVSCRIARIPGRNEIGVEIPNEHRRTVAFEEIRNSPEFRKFGGALPFVIGTDAFGKPKFFDMAAAPHFLSSGLTGSGKSVFVNGVVMSMIMGQSPEQCRLLLIDPKQTEFTPYRNAPHLLAPIVTEQAVAAKALRWLLGEIRRRNEVIASLGMARNISEYNAQVAEGDRMPAIVCLIDEAADLLVAPSDKTSPEAKAASSISTSLQKLAQIARSAGVYLAVLMQRPSVDIINGASRNNFPLRFAFRMSTATDSRTILDSSGAETLLGAGDGLMSFNGVIERIQGAFVDIKEICAAVDAAAKAHSAPEFVDFDEFEECDSDRLDEESPGGRKPLDNVIRDFLADGQGRSRAEISEEAKRFGYRSEGSVSSAIARLRLERQEKEAFGGTVLWRLRS